jgi:short-subunit dehydrogenase
MQRIVIFGATSAIAQEVARLWAARGAALYLVGRNADRLASVAGDLRVRGAASVEVEARDLSHTEDHEAVVERAAQTLGGLDVALIAHGSLGDQSASEQDFVQAEQELRVNFLSAASLLSHLANHFEAQRAGTLAVISSVAGDRGRASNYVYGAAKAGLTAFTSGLRNRLQRSGVAVVTIKPGFVDTPMTAHVPKGPLFVPPAVVAKGIVRAIDKRKDVVYLPWFWGPIMWIIRSIPERIFKRLSL